MTDRNIATSSAAADEPLVMWRPSPQRVAAANLTRFIRQAERVSGLGFADYHALWQWSVEHSPDFWRLVWSFCGVMGDPGDIELENPNHMPGARFFPHAQLNFAENLLRRNDSSDALVFWGEDKIRRRMRWHELSAAVSRLQQA